jgi:hypothetical protein
MKKLIVIIILFTLSFCAFAQSQYQTQEVYATIKSGINLNLRYGPGKNYKSLEMLKGGSIVSIENLNDYAQGWICVKSEAGNIGYVSTQYLVGNYVEEFSSRKYNVNPQEEDDWTNGLEKFFFPFFNFWKNLYLNIVNIGWWGFLIAIVSLALSGGIVYCIRSYDSWFEKPWIHYVLYFITILPTIGLFTVLLMYKYQPILSDRILLFLLALVPAILTAHAGWGIRECGMYDGERYKNGNYYAGQLLQFPIWIMITLTFWYTLCFPLIEYTEYAFIYHGGGFWRFLIGLIVILLIMVAVLALWRYVIVPKFLKIVGNFSLHIMTITLWWAMVKIAFNWAYANFNGFGYLLVLFFGGAMLLMLIIGVEADLQASRCPKCHNCWADETNLTDEGVSYESSTHWESMGNGNIRPHHSGAEVSNAKRLIATTIATHHWTTEHTCPKCQYKWDISHSEEVGRTSKDLGGRKWNEEW